MHLGSYMCIQYRAEVILFTLVAICYSCHFSGSCFKCPCIISQLFPVTVDNLLQCYISAMWCYCLVMNLLTVLLEYTYISSILQNLARCLVDTSLHIHNYSSLITTAQVYAWIPSITNFFDNLLYLSQMQQITTITHTLHWSSSCL